MFPSTLGPKSPRLFRVSGTTFTRKSGKEFEKKLGHSGFRLSSGFREYGLGLMVSGLGCKVVLPSAYNRVAAVIRAD